MKNIHKGAIAFGIVALLAVSFVAANGLGIGHQFGTLSEADKETAKANMDTIRTAIKNNDYDIWKAAMEDQISLMQSQLTVENFNQLVARQSEISQNQQHYGFGKGMGHMMKGAGYGDCPMNDADED